MVERLAAAVFLHVAREIEIEEVFPGPPAQGARLHLGKVDIPQRKHAQAFVKCAGDIGGREYNRNLVGLRITARLPGKQKKTREVLLVIFKVGAQNAGLIDRGCYLAGDGCGPVNAALRKHFDAARRVVEWNPFECAMLREETSALG